MADKKNRKKTGGNTAHAAQPRSSRNAEKLANIFQTKLPDSVALGGYSASDTIAVANAIIESRSTVDKEQPTKVVDMPTAFLDDEAEIGAYIAILFI